MPSTEKQNVLEGTPKLDQKNHRILGYILPIQAFSKWQIPYAVLDNEHKLVLELHSPLLAYMIEMTKKTLTFFTLFD